MKTRCLKQSIVTALCLTVMAVVIPSVSMGVDCSLEPMFVPPSFTITIARTATPIDFADPLGPANDPNNAAWVSMPTTSVELGYKIHADVYSQATHQDIFCAPDVGEPVRWLNVQAIHDGTNALFKITYADATKNDTIADIPLFHDSIAIGLPYPVSLFGPGCTVDGGLTLGGEILHMGMSCSDPALACCPMNLIFWRADKGEVENILANSPGTTIETPETDLGLYHTYQNWTAGTWTVIVGRVMMNPNPPVNAYPFQAALPGNNMVDLLGPNQAQHIIFSNWDGSIQERNGFKYVGVFGNLIIAP